MDDRKEVIVEGFGKVILKKPDIGISREADWIASRAFNECIKNGILPAGILEFKLRESGAWSEEDDRNYEKLLVIFAELSQELRKEKNLEKRKALTDDWLSKKNLLYQFNMAKSAFMSNSAERKAEEKKFEFLILRCCLKEDSSRIWNTVEDAYSSIDQSNLFAKVAEQYMLFINNINPEAGDVIPGEEEVKTPSEPVKDVVAEPAQ